VQYFTRGERRVRQEQNGIDDFFDFTILPTGWQPFQEIVVSGLCIGVSITPALRCLLECRPSHIRWRERGHRIQGALQHDLNGRSYTCDRLVNQGR